jgi:hypothetical protein
MTADELSRTGGRKLAEFLAVCAKAGWERDQFDYLESLWLAGHDKDGRVISDREALKRVGVNVR